MTLLSATDIEISYQGLRALRGVSFDVQAGEIFVLLGANGAGKTSILRGISGLVALDRGKISLNGHDMTRLQTHQIARLGVAHVPEGRRIFPSLTVRENLSVSYIKRPGHAMGPAIDRVCSLFPRLSERQRQTAGTLSGGEQQALAIGRALMNAPSLLMLDEPSLGLAPLLAHQVFQQLLEIRKQGISILLVEQNASCLEVATRGIVLANGQVELRGTKEELQQSDLVRRAYLGM
jgi:branched-chain amino acid transport system ATP-binding protein